MRVLVLNGSPQRNRSNTLRLAEALVSGMTDAGATAETVNVYDLKVRPCLGCFTCWIRTPGVCAVRDDMDSVLAKVKAADVLILATPVYCDGMTGALKVVVDRLIPAVHGGAEVRDGRIRHIRRADANLHTIALVSTCGFVEQETFAPLIQHVQAFANNMDCKFAGALTVTGNIKSREAYQSIARAAREAGGELVRNGLIPEHLQRAMHGHSVTAAEAAERLNKLFDQPPGSA